MKTAISATLALLLLALLPPPVATQEASSAPDGKLHVQIDGIFIPTIPNVPFSARVDGNWTDTLKSGAKVERKFYNLVGRDNSGRVHEENRRLVPADSSKDSALRWTTLNDPIAQSNTRCTTSEKICEIRMLESAECSVPKTKQATNGAETEDLGRKTIESLEVIGTRQITTINTGVAGENPMRSEKEIWYSPLLQINLVVIRTDPRFGRQELRVSQIVLAEPEKSFFEPTQGFKIVDLR